VDNGRFVFKFIFPVRKLTIQSHLNLNGLPPVQITHYFLNANRKQAAGGK
jgi:hypothetical protein